jgi:hypothetical protein
MGDVARSVTVVVVLVLIVDRRELSVVKQCKIEEGRRVGARVSEAKRPKHLQLRHTTNSKRWSLSLTSTLHVNISRSTCRWMFTQFYSSTCECSLLLALLSRSSIVQSEMPTSGRGI